MHGIDMDSWYIPGLMSTLVGTLGSQQRIVQLACHHECLQDDVGVSTGVRDATAQTEVRALPQ